MTAKKKARSRAKKAAPTPQDPHVAKALVYCRAVVAGEIPAGKLAIAACKRHLDDLERAKKGWRFEFDEGRAGRACRFLELLPHIKGELAGQTIVLEGWQCFVVTSVFGWMVAGTTKRRFRRVSIFVPRGNGKSCISSGIGVLCTAADGEAGAEVYSAATTSDQARIVFGDAQSMMRKAPALRERLGLDVLQHTIVQESSDSKFAPLSREASNQDGLNIHCAIIDEIHAHKTRETYDVIETGTAKRRNSLLWVISTAGSDSSGIGYEVYGFAKHVLEGKKHDENLFAAIWEADPEDDWTAPATWQKANPNWGVSVQPDVVAQLAAKAQQVASSISTFVTKHLNRWTTADQAAFDLRAWDRCADVELTPDQVGDAEAFIGVDLASKVDIAAKALLFRRDEPRRAAPDAQQEPEGQGAEQQEAEPVQQLSATERHYYLFVTPYLPESAVEEGRNASYQGWELEGRLKTTPGDVLDFATVKADVQADAGTYRVAEVAYDPWQSTQMAQELEAEGLTTVEVRPNVANFSPAMNELDAAMRSGRLHHDGSPVMRWMVGNVVGHRDAKDNIYPRKQKPENKIDGVVAALMALARAMVAETSSPYEVRGIRTIG